MLLYTVITLFTILLLIIAHATDIAGATHNRDFKYGRILLAEYLKKNFPIIEDRDRNIKFRICICIVAIIGNLVSTLRFLLAEHIDKYLLIISVIILFSWCRILREIIISYRISLTND